MFSVCQSYKFESDSQENKYIYIDFLLFKNIAYLCTNRKVRYSAECPLRGGLLLPAAFLLGILSLHWIQTKWEKMPVPSFEKIFLFILNNPYICNKMQ